MTDGAKVEAPAGNYLQEIMDRYETEGHRLKVVAVYEDLNAYLDATETVAREWDEGEVSNDEQVPADRYAAACTCDEVSDAFGTFDEARWWCREHRTAVGLEWQEWLTTSRILGDEAFSELEDKPCE